MSYNHYLICSIENQANLVLITQDHHMQQSKPNQIKETQIAQDGIYELTYQEEERNGGDGGVGVAARWPVVWRWLTRTKRA